MSGKGSNSTAAALMRMALSLLERDGELVTAARLQHALDALGCEPPGSVGGEEGMPQGRS